MLELQGERAGWVHEARVIEGGRIRSTSRSLMRIGRAGSVVEVEFETEFIETADHEPVSMRVVQRLGRQPVETRYEFGAEAVSVRSTQGERATDSVEVFPEGEWLTPVQADAYVEARLRAGASEVTYRELDPMSGLTPIVTTLREVSPGTFEADGVEFEGFRCLTTTSVAPGLDPAEELRDARGEIVRTSMDLGGIRMRMTRSSRERAAGGEIAGPEMMMSTFVRPDRVIERPRAARRAAYILHMDEGELPNLPATGAQAVERLGPARARVVVDVSHPWGADAGEANDARYLAASSAADADDPGVEALTRGALRGGEDDDAAARAERLRRAVYALVGEKNLGTALASASEVARTREGDCTEHAVLLAAMLRDAGIPSRVAAGLLYVERFAGEREVFGYHMWTQALLPGAGGAAAHRWVDLDATFPPELATDATHIALTTSDLSEGDGIMALSRMTAVLGRLRVSVESVE